MIKEIIFYTISIIFIVRLRPQLRTNFIKVHISLKDILMLLLTLLSVTQFFYLFFNVNQTHTKLIFILNKYNQKLNAPILFYVHIFLAAYAEELIFRLVPISLNCNKQDQIPSMIISQSIFAYLHIQQSSIAVVFSFTIGVIFWLSFKRNISLHSISISHAIYNIIVIHNYGLLLE